MNFNLNEHLVEKIFQYKNESKSITELAEKCKFSRVTITKYCNLLNIDIKVKQRRKRKQLARKYLLKDILEGKYPQYPPSKLKKRLVKEGYKEDKCEICEQTNEWNNMSLTLQVDHVNGNNRDHRLLNLRIVCPNCHSQTKTFGSKNIKS